MHSMGDVYETPTRKVKNVGKMKPEIRTTKNNTLKPKKQFAEGFTPPYPSSEESVSEGSIHYRLKTEEDQSDDEGRMELDDDLSVRYVDKTLRIAYFHPYFTMLYYVLLH